MRSDDTAVACNKYFQSVSHSVAQRETHPALITHSQPVTGPSISRDLLLKRFLKRKAARDSVLLSVEIKLHDRIH